MDAWEACREVSQRKSRQVVCTYIQADDSLGGLDHHLVDRPVHGLGQAPVPQGRRQVSFAIGPPEFSAALCDHRHDAGCRCQAHAVTVRSESVIFDKAHVNVDHLWSLQSRGVFWVPRAKENLQFEVVESYPVEAGGKLVSIE